MTSKLECKKVGGIEFQPTVLSLGCWALGGFQWGGQDAELSKDTLRAALDAGITNFDTAQAYGQHQESEKLCGEVLSKVREKVFIATKTSYIKEKEHIFKAIDFSLGNLQTDYIDLFYIHWPKRGLDHRPAMEALCEAREQGKIKGIGVSNFSVDQMKEVMEVGTIDAHQMSYSLYWRYPEKDIIPFCIENNIAVFSYSSIAQGILTGKFPKEPKFPEGDDRPRMMLFRPETWPHVYETTEELKKLAEEAGRPLGDLAIRWVPQQPGITSVIVGARNPDQVKRNVAAMDGEIPAEIYDRMAKIAENVPAHVPEGTINLWNYCP